MYVRTASNLVRKLDPIDEMKFTNIQREVSIHRILTFTAAVASTNCTPLLAIILKDVISIATRGDPSPPGLRQYKIPFLTRYSVPA